jgi:hypothetical protein
VVVKVAVMVVVVVVASGGDGCVDDHAWYGMRGVGALSANLW